jgi:hypothetical protein
MTVKELIEELQAFPKDFEVRFADGPGSELYLLSLYDGEKKDKCVWIDIGIE